jgi:hypothetical protein
MSWVLAGATNSCSILTSRLLAEASRRSLEVLATTTGVPQENRHTELYMFFKYVTENDAIDCSQ